MKIFRFVDWTKVYEAEDKEIKDLIKTIPSKGDYQYKGVKVLTEDLPLYIDSIIKGDQQGLMITGQSGVGKSFAVNDRMEKAGKKYGEDWTIIKGKSSAAAVYITLWKHNGKIIVFDDCDGIFRSEDATEILKAALEDKEPRRVDWNSASQLKDPEDPKKTVPRHIEFKGKVIFISNLSQREINKNLKTRTYNIEVALTPKEMLAYMQDKLYKVRSPAKEGTRKLAFALLKIVAKENPKVQLNMRSLEKAIRIAYEHPKDLDKIKRLIDQQTSYE